MTARAAIVLAGVAVLALAGCSNVPNSSHPQVIRSLGPAERPAPPEISPQAGADPATIVNQFLNLNAASDDKHQAAKQYLTPAARSRWSDSTATVVDHFTVSPMDPRTHTVTVNAVKVGQLAANGIYTPMQQGDGTGDEAIPLSYGMAQIDGQWRIDQPAPGVVVPASDLSSSHATPYQLHPLYFFDLSGKHLVADPRYSSLSDQQTLANWLLAQLIAGPRQELANAVQALPDQINAKTASVTITGQLTSVEIPGSSAFDHDTLSRLADQLANTFVPNSDLTAQITDNGHPVAIPGVGTTFNVDDFPAAHGPLDDPPRWFLNAQGLVASGGSGQAVDGPLGHHNYGLHAIAAGLNGSSSDYRVAGVAGPAAHAHLLVGTFKTGLHDSGLRPGRLTAPAWISDESEVWVGDGSTLVRVPANGPPTVVSVSLPSGSIAGITAVRFSADGTRVALVIVGSDGSSVCYVGTVERGGSSVRIDNLLPVTPSNIKITDMDWNDETTLYVTGSGPAGYSVWQVQSDGSAWTDRQAGSLPAAPDSITAAPGALPWVSANGNVYEQVGSTWQSPFQPANVVVQGTSPCYLE